MLTQQYMSSLLNTSQVELKLRIYSHPLTPDVHLMRVSESDAVIETTSYIHDLISTLEIDLGWIKRDTY